MTTIIRSATQTYPSNIIEVQAAVSPGLPNLHLVGLRYSAGIEARVRCLTAIRHAGLRLPQQRVTVTLAPAELRAEGPSLDLPIALGILVAAGVIAPLSDRLVFAGELSLTGDLHPIRGALPMALAAKAAGAQAIVVPLANVREAQISGLSVIGARNLTAAIEAARELRVELPWKTTTAEVQTELDLSDVIGHVEAKRVLEQAAIDGGHVLMVGPYGCGKTLLARRFSTILPPLTAAESLETSAIWSVAGRLHPDSPRVLRRPFRAPHHTISVAGLVGGGSPARPGEASLAHNGVLFLDELPELSRQALEALRTLLTRGVAAHGARGLSEMPARFQLIGAMSACPCGERGVRKTSCRKECICPPDVIRRHEARIAPLAHFFKHRIEVPMLPPAELASNLRSESSASVRARVEAARER